MSPRFQPTWAVVLLPLCAAASAQTPLDATFVYQGVLRDGGALPTGAYAMEFSVWNAASGGSQVSPTLIFDGLSGHPAPIAVNDGVFSVALDFGAGVFNGQQRWLQVSVSGVVLGGRQPIYAAPYAVRALSVGGIDGHSLDASDGDPLDSVFVGASGTVGVLDTSPSTARSLTIRGVGTFSDFLQFRSSAGSDTWHISGTSGGLNFAESHIADFRLFLQPGGAVGVGTADPRLSFQVAGPNAQYGRPSLGVTFGADEWLYLHASANPSLIWSASGALRFGSETSLGSGYVEHMRISSTGDVGIGAAAPICKLDIGASYLLAANVSGADARGTWLTLHNDTSTLHWKLIATGTGNGEGPDKLIITSGNLPNTVGGPRNLVLVPGGNVGVGVTSPAQRLHVDGNVQASCGILSCSDARFKKNIGPLDAALAAIVKLRPVRFNWRTGEFPDHSFPEGRQIGFIAQEACDVVPECVQTGADGYMSVDYGRLTPVLVAALQEQQVAMQEQQAAMSELHATIEQLRAAIHEQQKQVQTLRAELADLRAR